jgi:hypothetical protein
MRALDLPRKFLGHLLGLPDSLGALHRKIDEAKVLAAGDLLRSLRSGPALDGLREAEFKVFSQFGDDGILQYLVSHAQIDEDSFIEFGVADYTESNTRFLLIHDNWRGLIIDSGAKNIHSIRRDPIFWRHELLAIQAFVTRENINALIGGSGIGARPSVLSVDIDGNDYWVWEALDVVTPNIVVIEYNCLFGARRALTIPYQADFQRARAHYSGLFGGCSLRALGLLAEKKGYAFVGCNSSGNNAYFVRRDRLGSVKPMPLDAGFVESRVRDSRDRKGALSFVGGGARLRLIEDLEVWDLEANRIVRLADVFAEATPGA